MQFIVIVFWGLIAIMIAASAQPRFLDDKGKECDPPVRTSNVYE